MTHHFRLFHPQKVSPCQIRFLEIVGETSLTIWTNINEPRRTVFSVDFLHNIGKERIFLQQVNEVVEHFSGVLDSVSEAGDKPRSFMLARDALSGQYVVVYVLGDQPLLEQLGRDGEIVLKQRTILDIRHAVTILIAGRDV